MSLSLTLAAIFTFPYLYLHRFLSVGSFFKVSATILFQVLQEIALVLRIILAKRV